MEFVWPMFIAPIFPGDSIVYVSLNRLLILLLLEALSNLLFVDGPEEGKVHRIGSFGRTETTIKFRGLFIAILEVTTSPNRRVHKMNALVFALPIQDALTFHMETALSAT